MLVMKLVARRAIANLRYVLYGVVLAVVGMAVFNLGLTYGLANLGGQSGSLVPAAFMHAGRGRRLAALRSTRWASPSPPLFAWFLGFGATLAEPALNALGHHRREPHQRRLQEEHADVRRVGGRRHRHRGWAC